MRGDTGNGGVGTGNGGGGYSYSGAHKRRRKTDWAGIGPGDAFKPSIVDYHLRLAAQSRFYELVRKVQRAAAREAGHTSETFEAQAKPQLSPCYTSYPAAIAAYAAAGLTGYLEYEARVPAKVLHERLERYLDDPAKHHKANVDPAVLRKMARIVTERVQARLLLEDLAQVPAMSSVELYRLFSASQEDASFRSVPSIISAVILYGDVLAGVDSSSLHRTTRALHDDISAASEPYAARLSRTKSARGMLQLGEKWVRAVCRCLIPYLPPPEPEDEEIRPSDRRQRERLRSLLRQHDLSALTQPDPDEEPDPNQRIPPLNDPSPPALFDPPSPAQQAGRALGASRREFADESAGGPRPDTEHEGTRDILHMFAMALHQAGGQHSQYEDVRRDLLEMALRGSGFQPSPIEGSPVSGHEVNIDLGDHLAAGEIFDKAVEPSHDTAAHDRLVTEAQPIADELRRSLYPNIMELPRTDKLRTSGSLDPARLALAEVSDAVFKRYRIEERADRRGKPVLLIACDGSGSLNARQMRMLKVLAAAWIRSTARSEVVVMAGLYHSGSVRSGITGPLVQWMHHPRKTPAISVQEATRAVVALPERGTGVQADALSLAFMLEEARRVARGRMVYQIVITDCAWNRCLHLPKSGEDEVREFFETAYERGGDTLHTTLVAVGVDKDRRTGIDHVVDKVIKVPDEKLADYATVASQIGVYVASCMRERRALVSRD